MQYKDGEPCTHPGCLNHVTHPCEGCGRIAGRRTCRKCGGTGEVIYYFDAGDHFGGSPAPGSGWAVEPYSVCRKKCN